MTARIAIPGPRPFYLPPFRIDLEVRAGVPHVLSAAALVRVLRAALLAGGAPEPASVGLALADDAELARLNRTFLGSSGATDVLSFPLLPPEAYPHHPGGQSAVGRAAAGVGGSAAAAGPSRAAGPSPAAGRAFLLPPGTRLHLGDIVISVERAVRQAVEGRGGQTGDLTWTPADELRLLVTHGGLHLCGWDHAEPVEEAAMRALERTILAAR